jgi:hypothetical protein
MRLVPRSIPQPPCTPLVRRAYISKTRSISPLYFQQLPTSFSRNSFPVKFIRKTPGGWGGSVGISNQNQESFLSLAHRGKSDELTPTESHSCTKHGGEGSKKRAPGETHTDIFVGVGACPSRRQHDHTVSREGHASPSTRLPQAFFARGHFLLTPLESALPQNAPITPLQSALTNSLDLKSFRIRTYKKKGGRGARC